MSELTVNGAALQADTSGALVWAEQATVIVADLHLEKGSAFARHGTLLPPYDSRATLARLAAVMRAHRPRRVICLGDSFHDGDAPTRLAREDAAAVAALAAATDWIWIAGNHDPRPPAGLGGRVTDEIVIGPLVFRHQAVNRPVSGEVSGHFHPRASIDTRGGRVHGRCFVEDGRRVILPAFGAYAGGLDVRDRAVRELMAADFAVHLIGRERVHRFRSRQLES